MDTIHLIGISTLFGATAMYCGMKILEHYRHIRKENEELKKQNDNVILEYAGLLDQLKGKQLPYWLRDGLEDWKALENNDAFERARQKLFLQEQIKILDQADDRKRRKDEVYSLLRNHKKPIRKGKS
jgi:hypothetical protein